jgi:RNA polymerase sigma factor (TIGR02999 family)
MHSALADVSQLMDRLRQGSNQAAGELVSIFYPELRRLARAQMRGERREHTWQPTVLVNQLYLELLKVKGLRKIGDGAEDDRRAFFGLAAHLMRRLLIHHSRPLSQRADMTEISEGMELQGPVPEDLAVVENLLAGLERVDPLFRTVMEMKAFEGLSMEEIAGQLDIPLRTAYRRWTFARRWLAEHMDVRLPHRA